MDLKKLVRRGQDAALAKVAFLLMVMEWAENTGKALVEDWVPGSRKTGGLAGAARAQTSAVLTVVVVGVVIIVGILIYSQIQTSLPAPSNNDLDNASQNATDTFGDAMELAPVILVVLVASVVLAVVQRFR
jgi:hypothetical protein